MSGALPLEQCFGIPDTGGPGPANVRKFSLFAT